VERARGIERHREERLRVAMARSGGRRIEMGRLRDRGRPGGTGYTLRETRCSIGEDFLVETESGERAFKVNGKARPRP
jgi:hypothetical protein